MPTTVAQIEVLSRQRLIEVTPRYWTSAELVEIIAAGVRDLWRNIVDLKQEHYLVVDDLNVTFQPASDTLTGVPTNVHKVYLLEPRDVSNSSANVGLIFTPKDKNHADFRGARNLDPIDPTGGEIFYAITGQGAPVNAPTIYCAPRVTAAVNISFCYVPTLGTLTSANVVPIPGEADNALIAWTVAFARAKERDDRSPDPNWLAIYATEKQGLLTSLGLRQYQEPSFSDAVFECYW